MVTMTSGVWAGSIPLETAWDCAEVTATTNSPRTVKQELERIGFLGYVPASHQAQPIAAHSELHIEQGPILENEEQRIGVVTGAQALPVASGRGEGQRQPCRHDAHGISKGLTSGCGQDDRGLQRDSSHLWWSLHHRTPSRRAWQRQLHGAHVQVHAGHAPSKRRQVGRDGDSVS